MALIGTELKTLLDWAKEYGPEGKEAMTVEMLNQENRILDDMLFKEGNLPTGEQTEIRTGLPTVYYRLINQGTPNSKATTAQVTENAAQLVGRSQLDKKLVQLNGGGATYRLRNAKPFVEAMSQTQTQTLVYGSGENPEEYVGFMPRYSDLSAPNALNILNAGGAGSDNTSALLVNWGEDKVFGVFPKGTKAGIEHEDIGLDDATDASGNTFRAYKDEWTWDMGLVVKDWRQIVRIANIDVSDLISLANTQALTAATSIIKQMTLSLSHLPSGAGPNAAFYVNRTVLSHLQIIALESSTSAVKVEEAINQFGQTIQEMRFLGVPVRMTDRIINTEAAVV